MKNHRPGRYDSGMTTKIAVSLPDDQVAAARRAVAEGRATSVSAYIADSLAQRQDYEDLTTLLADMAAESGVPTDEDRRWARTALGLA
jgi:Arc/MetJ-type ribon-helix-helix transcriptional regulator